MAHDPQLKQLTNGRKGGGRHPEREQPNPLYGFLMVSTEAYSQSLPRGRERKDALERVNASEGMG